MDPTVSALRDQLIALANQLAQLQQNANYQGADMPTLYASEMSLRSKAMLLNTAMVGQALTADANAQTQLKSAIQSANQITSIVADVSKALQLSADLITLAGGVISDNPAAIVGAAAQTIADATANPAPTGAAATE